MRNAFASVQTAHNARFGEVLGISLPLGYGDFAGEVRAAEEATGVYPVQGAEVLVVRGPDAAEYLSGLSTNHVRALAAGKAQGDLLCATKGKLLHPLIVARLRGDQYLVLTEPGDGKGVAAHLEAYHVREDAEIGQAPLVRIDLIGPGAAEALTTLDTPPAAAAHVWRDAPLLTLSYPLGPVPRVLVLLPEAHAAPWIEQLLAQVPAARLVGYEAADEVRIRAGVPRYRVDYDTDFLPAEAALYDRLSFQKGCYVGQEVHARLHHRGHVNRKLMGLALPAGAPPPQPGSDLYAAGAVVGQVTSMARLATAEVRRGIALVRYQHLQSGAPVATTADGPAQVQLVPLATDLGAGREGTDRAASIAAAPVHRRPAPARLAGGAAVPCC